MDDNEQPWGRDPDYWQEEEEEEEAQSWVQEAQSNEGSDLDENFWDEEEEEEDMRDTTFSGVLVDEIDLVHGESMVMMERIPSYYNLEEDTYVPEVEVSHCTCTCYSPASPRPGDE